MKPLSIVLLVALHLVTSRASVIKLSPHAAAHFQRLMVEHQDLFQTKEEVQERLQNFIATNKMIDEHNNGPNGRYFQLEHNKMSVLSTKEKSDMLGRIIPQEDRQLPKTTTTSTTTTKPTTTTTTKPTTTTTTKPTTTTTTKPTTTTTTKPTTTTTTKATTTTTTKPTTTTTTKPTTTTTTKPTTTTTTKPTTTTTTKPTTTTTTKPTTTTTTKPTTTTTTKPTTTTTASTTPSTTTSTPTTLSTTTASTTTSTPTTLSTTTASTTPSTTNIITDSTTNPSTITDSTTTSIITDSTTTPSIITDSTTTPSIITDSTTAPNIITDSTTTTSIITDSTTTPSIITDSTTTTSIITDSTTTNNIITDSTTTPSIITDSTTTTTSTSTISTTTSSPLRTSLDLRTSTLCGQQLPIKDQSRCGACWAFSAIAPIEWAKCNKTGVYTRLSDQELVSCDTRNGGCNGGDPFSSMVWITSSRSGALATELSYPYTSGGTGISGNCSLTTPGIVTGATLASYTMLPCTVNSGTSASVADIENAITNYGVVAACVLVKAAFQSYKSGVFVDPTCQTVLSGKCLYTNTNHCGSLVGWGFNSTVNMPYWIFRNQWGTSWGMGGYMNIQKGVNMCGIESEIIYTTVV